MHSGHRITKGFRWPTMRLTGSYRSSTARPASAIRTRVTSTVRWPARMRSLFAVARPAVISSGMVVEVKPCASKIEVVHPLPSRPAYQGRGARQRSAHSSTKTWSRAIAGMTRSQRGGEEWVPNSVTRVCGPIYPTCRNSDRTSS